MYLMERGTRLNTLAPRRDQASLQRPGPGPGAAGLTRAQQPGIAWEEEFQVQPRLRLRSSGPHAGLSFSKTEIAGEKGKSRGPLRPWGGRRPRARRTYRRPARRSGSGSENAAQATKRRLQQQQQLRSRRTEPLGRREQLAPQSAWKPRPPRVPAGLPPIGGSGAGFCRAPAGPDWPGGSGPLSPASRAGAICSLLRGAREAGKPHFPVVSTVPREPPRELGMFHRELRNRK
ncbi:uncharacterized protein ACOB8E_017696 [Sarcophilus harrisii]